MQGPARFFTLDTASLSMLGYEHDQSEPAIRLWNDARHVDQVDWQQLASRKWAVIQSNMPVRA